MTHHPRYPGLKIFMPSEPVIKAMEGMTVCIEGVITCATSASQERLRTAVAPLLSLLEGQVSAEGFGASQPLLQEVSSSVSLVARRDSPRLHLRLTSSPDVTTRTLYEAVIDLLEALRVSQDLEAPVELGLHCAENGLRTSVVAGVDGQAMDRLCVQLAMRQIDDAITRVTPLFKELPVLTNGGRLDSAFVLAAMSDMERVAHPVVMVDPRRMPVEVGGRMFTDLVSRQLALWGALATRDNAMEAVVLPCPTNKTGPITLDIETIARLSLTKAYPGNWIRSAAGDLSDGETEILCFEDSISGQVGGVAIKDGAVDHCSVLDENGNASVSSEMGPPSDFSPIESTD